MPRWSYSDIHTGLERRPWTVFPKRREAMADAMGLHGTARDDVAKAREKLYPRHAPAWAMRSSRMLVDGWYLVRTSAANGGASSPHLCVQLALSGARKRRRTGGPHRLRADRLGSAGSRCEPVAMRHREVSSRGLASECRQEISWLSIFDNIECIKINCRRLAMPSSYVIGDHFESFIKEQIQQGRYASASEVVRDGLRALEDRERLREVKLEALRSDIKRGANSGGGIPAKSVFAAARKRIAQSGASGSGRR